MAHAAPRFLFIPVSGPAGAGEYHRSLAIARTLERHWPGCRIRFVLNRAASYTETAPYDGLRIDASPTRANAEVVRCIREERPDVVVFDSSGRLAQYRAARAAGARVVYISSRPSARWKGFRWRRMRLLDQHWFAQPRFLGGRLGAWERFKLRTLGRPQVVTLDVVHEPIETKALLELRARLHLEAGRYIVVCPGGGGTFGHAPDATRVFLDAARSLAALQPQPVVAVVGSRMAEQTRTLPAVAGLHVLSTLPNAQLLGLLRDASIVVVNGGSLLLQSMAQRVPAVAAPIADDQRQRIQRCAEEGYVRPSVLEAAALTAHCISLLEDEAARAELRARLSRLALRNGVEVAAEAVASLLNARPASVQPGSMS